MREGGREGKEGKEEGRKERERMKKRKGEGREEEGREIPICSSISAFPTEAPDPQTLFFLIS